MLFVPSSFIHIWVLFRILAFDIIRHFEQIVPQFVNFPWKWLVYDICSSWQGLIHHIKTKWPVSHFCILFAVIQLQLFLHGCLLMLSINYDLCYPKWGWKQSSRFKKVKDVQDHNESVISSQTRDAVFCNHHFSFVVFIYLYDLLTYLGTDCISGVIL